MLRHAALCERIDRSTSPVATDFMKYEYPFPADIFAAVTAIPPHTSSCRSRTASLNCSRCR